MLRKLTYFSLLAGTLILGPAGSALAVVEWNLEKTLQIDGTPLDTAVSADGKMTFVLTDNGTILIYSETGELTDKFKMDEALDSIAVSPTGDKLFLTDRETKSVRIVSLDFVVDINIAGAPFKGPADAPVTVAIFSDFQ